jgi:exodeoxyribonuclease V beta subunit
VFLSRLLSTEDGLRHLTDLDHIADILASRPQFSSSVGPLECLEVLEDLIEGAEEESDEQVRRIETDQQAVRIMTIHASKGLQFPIVFLPTLFHPSTRRMSDPMMFTGTAKTPLFPRDWVHVPTDAKGIIEEDIATRDNRKRATQSDIDADNRRLFYVAMTRAQHKIVGYWFPGQATPIDPFINAVAKSLKLSKPPTKTADLAV